MISPEQLRRYSYFGGVDESLLKEHAMFSNEMEAASDVELFQVGDPAEFLYIVLEGSVDLLCLLGNGDPRVVDTLEDGELVGWSALVPPYKYKTTGRVARFSRLIKIDGPALRQLCEGNRGLGYHLGCALAQVLTSRLEGARIRLATVD